MASILTCLNIAQQALLVNQAALSVVSNNIANMDTEGYSKQALSLSPSVNYTPINGSAMTQVNSADGVQIDSVLRYTDEYLQTYFREQTSSNSYLNEYQNVASNLANTMNELSGTGLEDALTSFYAAAKTLSGSPTDSVARTNYIQQAQSVALKFNSLSSTLSDIRTSLVGNPSDVSTMAASKISIDTSKVNQYLTQIAKINQQIVGISSGNMSPNSLLDTRDQIITELSKYIPVNVTNNSNGSVNLSLNGVNLVQGDDLLGTLSVNSGDDTTPAIIDVVNSKGTKIATNINSYISSGEMGAILAVGGTSTSVLTVNSVIKNLDQLASGFAGVINGLQTTADANGTPMAMDKTTKTLIASTQNIFTSGSAAPITASNIKINNTVLSDPYLIAAARVSDTTDTTQTGNNSNMQAILNTRTGVYATLGNTSPEGFLSSFVGTLGLKVEDIQSDLKSQTTVLTQAKTQLTSATGVSMDEELVDLVKYQKAYQASARIFSICNELLDNLINLGK